MSQQFYDWTRRYHEQVGGAIAVARAASGGTAPRFKLPERDLRDAAKAAPSVPPQVERLITHVLLAPRPMSFDLNDPHRDQLVRDIEAVGAGDALAVFRTLWEQRAVVAAVAVVGGGGFNAILAQTDEPFDAAWAQLRREVATRLNVIPAE